MEETATDTIPQETEPAIANGWNFQLDARETITLFQALRVYLQALNEQPDSPVDSLSTVVELMRVIKPAAVEASQLIKTQQI